MPYRIVIGLEDSTINPDKIHDIANFLSEALDRMQISYSIDCFKDDMKLMIGISNPEEPQ